MKNKRKDKLTKKIYKIMKESNPTVMIGGTYMSKSVAEFILSKEGLKLLIPLYEIDEKKTISIINNWEKEEFGDYKCDCVPATKIQINKLAKRLNELKTIKIKGIK